MKSIAVIFGTRPEAIKLAPVIMGLKKYPTKFRVLVVVTAQHRQMLDQVLKVFNIKPDYDLNLMRPNQSLFDITSLGVKKIGEVLRKEKPDMVIVQGDTTTTFVASLAAFYLKIKIAHVEAGLRTFSKYSPFPEEINRVMTSHLADLHFAPTKWAANNLIKEGIQKSKIFLTGNTVIDALLHMRKMIKRNPKLVNLPPGLKSQSGFMLGSNHQHQSSSHRNLVINTPFVLITGHRRESFGQGFKNICRAIKILARKFSDHLLIYPVHLNPNVRCQVLKVLRGYKNIILTNPVDYPTFVYLMDKCKLILTDSGGIQEEAPTFGKPVLVMRDTTERPEAVWSGTAKLVGTNPKAIINSVTKLLNYYSVSKRDELKRLNRLNRPCNVFGTGNAAKKITKHLLTI